MTQVLQIGNHTLTSAELIPLLAGYQMLPQLWRFIIIDLAIAKIELTNDEQKSAQEQFYAQNKITKEAERSSWLEHYGMTYEQLQTLATREHRLDKFKEVTWGSSLESYFLTHKSKLDQIIYSLIRTTDQEVAQELYFRIAAGEQTFTELARSYSQGPEAQTGGLIGPVDLSTPHPVLAQMLSTSSPGQLCPPVRLGEWFVIVRLEKFMPAQLDESMRSQLLNSLFETWLSEQMHQVGGVRIQNTPALVS